MAGDSRREQQSRWDTRVYPSWRQGILQLSTGAKGRRGETYQSGKGYQPTGQHRKQLDGQENWRCRCGYQVWPKKDTCPKCQSPRSEGDESAGLTGGLAAKPQETSPPSQEEEAQQEVNTARRRVMKAEGKQDKATKDLTVAKDEVVAAHSAHDTAEAQLDKLEKALKALEVPKEVEEEAGSSGPEEEAEEEADRPHPHARKEDEEEELRELAATIFEEEVEWPSP
jgi:hypothetical protein